MRSAVRRSGKGVLLTIRDDVEALPSRDHERRAGPRILSSFDGPTGSARSRTDAIPTDRSDAMRIRIQVDRSWWSRIPLECEKNSDRRSR
jgi:hypothetical protein